MSEVFKLRRNTLRQELEWIKSQGRDAKARAAVWMTGSTAAGAGVSGTVAAALPERGQAALVLAFGTAVAAKLGLELGLSAARSLVARQTWAQQARDEYEEIHNAVATQMAAINAMNPEQRAQHLASIGMSEDEFAQCVDAITENVAQADAILNPGPDTATFGDASREP
jgi:hypothetical protein